MKKTFTTSILVAVLGFTATTATAKSWRINSDVTKQADFIDINAAMSSENVTAGDTLYLDPGCSISTQQTVDKQVTIVGPGYFRNDSPHRFAYLTQNVNLVAPNIKIEGVSIIGNSSLCLGANNVIVERCYIEGEIKIGYKTISNYSTAQNAIIRQCFIQGLINGRGNNSNESGFSTSENCLIIQQNNEHGIKNLYAPTIHNNSIKETYNAGNYPLFYINNGQITNNILIHTTKNNQVFYGVANSVINNNVLSCDEEAYAGYIGDNKYLNSGDDSQVFKLEGTHDQQYQLKDDSPAKGYATDGGDCGHTGGTYPYVISGLPAGYPYYTKAIIDTKAKDGKINVSLNIKMQNE